MSNGLTFPDDMQQIQIHILMVMLGTRNQCLLWSVSAQETVFVKYIKFQPYLFPKLTIRSLRKGTMSYKDILYPPKYSSKHTASIQYIFARGWRVLCCEKKIFVSHVYTKNKKLKRQQNSWAVRSQGQLCKYHLKTLSVASLTAKMFHKCFYQECEKKFQKHWRSRCLSSPK